MYLKGKKELKKKTRGKKIVKILTGKTFKSIIANYMQFFYCYVTNLFKCVVLFFCHSKGNTRKKKEAFVKTLEAFSTELFNTISILY